MNQNFHTYQCEQIEIGKDLMIDNIKILLYKKDETIFETLDFENDLIYQEPLLYAYFNDKDPEISLEQILYGYIEPTKRTGKISISTDKFGRVYLPNFGWLHTETNNEKLLLFTNSSEISLFNENQKITFSFEPLEIIENTNVELIKYPISLLKQCYYDVDSNLVEVEIEDITVKHREDLYEAWNLIKTLAPNHFEIIQKATSKCVIFNVDTYLRNSFATKQAQGVGFFNAYQPTYNEVFFVDDIAHQTGHVIFYKMIYEVENFIKIPSATVIQNIKVEDVIIEKRDIYIVFHALYTYYTTFLCLDACLDSKVFVNEKKHEALARICFYINKCYNDLMLVENSEQKPDGIFTEDGMIIYNEIKNMLNLMILKYGEEVKEFDMSNQPYNFTYSKFTELNPFVTNI